MIKILLLLLVLFTIITLIFLKLSKLRLFKSLPKFFVIVIFVFVFMVTMTFRFLNDLSSKGSYIPAQFDGKQLIPGKVEFEKK